MAEEDFAVMNDEDQDNVVGELTTPVSVAASSLWTGVIQKASDGVTDALFVLLGESAEIVPFGAAISMVTSRIQECRELRRLTNEMVEKMITNIRRTQNTLLQLQDNQLQDQTRHKPIAKLLNEYAGLLGEIHELCKRWSRLSCGSQLCYASTYSGEFEEHADDLAALKSDLVLGTLAKIDAEARINAANTQSAIANADEAAQSRHDETTLSLKQAAQVQEETRGYVQDLKELIEESVTQNAMTVPMTHRWDSIVVWDWDAKAVGVTSDAARAIAVGLVNQENSPQQLLLQFFDTEEEYNYRTARSGGVLQQKPTWAMTMKAAEMKRVRKAFLKEKETEPVLIHEEPLLDDQAWYARAWWVPERKDGCLGLKIEVKASQDKFPTVHYILFALQGELFRKVGKPVDLTASDDEVAKRQSTLLAAAKATHFLPEPFYSGPEPMRFATTKKPQKLDYKAEGDSSPLELEIDARGGTTRQEQSYRWPKNMHQHVVSGKIILRNPSEEMIRIRSVETEYREGNSSETFQKTVMTDGDYLKQSTFVGHYKGSYMIWGVPHPEAEYIQEGTELEIPAQDSIQIVVKAIIVVEDCTAYQGRPLDMRIHDGRLTDPITIRATFRQEGDGQETKSICWDVVNPILHDRSILSYENYLQLKDEDDPEIFRWKQQKFDGIGDDFLCDLWLLVDDPKTMERFYVIITSRKDDSNDDSLGKQWYIRANSTQDKIQSSHIRINSSSFRRIVYDGKKAGQTVVEQPDWSFASSTCFVRLLLDLERDVVYGLEAEINIRDGEIVGKKAMYFA